MGMGKPVAYCFQRSETKENLEKILDYFCKINDASKTKIVMVGKYLTEITNNVHSGNIIFIGHFCALGLNVLETMTGMPNCMKFAFLSQKLRSSFSFCISVSGLTM